MLFDMRSLRRALQFSRRQFLMSGAAALAWSQTSTPACSLNSEQEEGPYYIEERILRRDIREGKPGVPLQLRVALVDAKSCRPLENAAIDVWHCDALGVYSGFTTKMSPDGHPGGLGERPWSPGPGPGMPPPFGQFAAPRPPMPPPRGRRQVDATRYLRGVQITDALGRAEFLSLYPGWYSGRAIHVHLKVHTGTAAANAHGHVCHTGQLFFPEEITAEIAKLSPYTDHSHVHRTSQSEDGIFNGQHGSECLLRLARIDPRSNEDGFVATVTLAVDPEATPALVRPFGPGGPPPPPPRF